MSEQNYSIGGTGSVPEAAPMVNPVAGTKIFLKRSDTQGKKPAAGDAEYGELFVNYHSNSPMLCFKDNADTIVEIRPLTEVELALGELTDVDTTGATSGMVLSYNGSTWVPVSAASIAIDVDLAYTPAADKGTITNTAGDDATIPLANGTSAGLTLNNYTTAEKDKLGGIEDGAEANVGTDLGYTPAADKGTVTSTTGTDAEIPLGNGTNAGLSLNNFSATDKDKLDGLPDPGAITDGTVTSVDSGNGLTGGPITDAGTLSVQADGDTITVGAAGIKVTDGKFAEPGDIPDVSLYLPLAGGNMTGGVTATVRTVAAGAGGLDLATGNLWECAGIAVPNPDNAVAGMTGVIVFSDAPTAWGSNFKFPDGTPIAPSSFPAVAPFYVKGSSEILVGKAVEGIA